MLANVKIVLEMGFIACLFGAMAMGFAHKATLYRILASLAITAIATGSTLEYGLKGLLLVVGFVGVMPLAVFVTARALEWLVWRNLRQRYPSEPTNPPGERLTICGAYRLLWLA